MFTAAAPGVGIGRVVTWLELAPGGAALLRSSYKGGSEARRGPPDGTIAARRSAALRRGSEDFGTGDPTAQLGPRRLRAAHVRRGPACGNSWTGRVGS